MTCASTVRSVTNRRPAIARLERPSATQTEHLALAVSQLGERVFAAPSPQEARDDRRVDDGLALGDPTQRVDEHGNVEDALLEQVADALGMLFEQPQRVAGLDVLGEDEDADIGVLGADPLGGDEALVGVRRRHADVDDRGVRAFESHLSEQALGVVGLGHDVDAGVGRAGARSPRA